MMRAVKLREAVFLLAFAAAVAGRVLAEEPHVATVVASVRESVAKLKAADPQAVPMAFWDFDGTTCPNRNRGDGAKLLPEFKFDARTPAMLLVHGDNDDIASSLGSLLVYTELHRRRIPAQLTVFSGASHGLNDNVNVRSWRRDVLDWLVSRGL